MKTDEFYVDSHHVVHPLTNKLSNQLLDDGLAFNKG
jgi:hypothetical protein